MPNVKKQPKKPGHARRASGATNGHVLVPGLESGLVVTSVRVHPTVMRHVRDLCEQSALSFNQLLILAVSVLEKDPVVKRLIATHHERVTAQSEFARRMEGWSRASRVGPSAVNGSERETGHSSSSGENGTS